MTITAEMLAKRTGFVGSSDAAAILGLDPYRSAADVYYSKVAELEDRVSAKPAVEMGNLLEDDVLELASASLGKLRPGVAFERGRMLANTDAIVLDRPEIVEVKTTGIVGPHTSEDWGQEGTDEVPERVVVQVHHQLFCAGPEYRRAHIATLIGGRGFGMYVVERSDELADLVSHRCEAFWQNHVEPRIPPSDSLPNIETLKAIRREPDSVVDVSDDVVAAWRNAREIRLAAEKAEAEAVSALVAALGEAEAGRSSIGLVTYRLQQRKGYIVDPSEFRVLRFKKGGAL